MKILIPLVYLVWTFGFAGFAVADYVGAEEVLERAAALADAEDEGGKPTSLGEIRAEIAALREVEGAPTDLAKRWIALNDGALTLLQSGVGNSYELQFSEILGALPGPAAWPELRDLAGPSDEMKFPARLERLHLTWLADRLLGDSAAVVADYRAILAEVEQFGSSTPMFSRYFGDLAEATMKVAGDPRVVAEILNARLDLEIRDAEKAPSSYGSRSYRLPRDLGLLGEAGQRAFLVKALTTFPGELQFVGDLTLAREVALERVDELASPPWALAVSLRSGELFDQLMERFPDSRDGRGFSEALAYAIGRALVADNVERALELAKNFDLADASYDLWSDVANAGGAGVACEFWNQILAADPGVDGWDSYLEVALRANRTDELMTLLGATLAKEDLAADVRAKLVKTELGVTLGADRVEDGVELIRGRLAADGAGLEAANLGVKLATIGRLEDRGDWFEEGIAAARAAVAGFVGGPGQSESTASVTADISRLLLAAGRGEEAEALWIDVLGATMAGETQGMLSRYSARGSAEALVNLVGIYSAAGRFADVMALVNSAEGWNARDLVEIADFDVPTGARTSEPLAVSVARALAETGREGEAVRLLEALLPELSGEDSAYELYVTLRGPEALPSLERIAAVQAFEERPLIWRARILLDEGKLDEAKAVAEAAIRIDPSDGEQGSGDRMRVYSVLADVVAARGDAERAEFFRDVVRSIRLSERGDAFWEAGLLAAAIGIYEESLGYFSDAYCVQSRLALRLTEQGKWEEAEEHYRRAYELMPESFGRVESHCFGCERAFAGERQQTIAERVFRKLAAEQPENPRVHYLLGYLLQEQGLDAEAVTEFRRAVELDPEYLNAWKKLTNAPLSALTPEDRNAVAAKLIELDPAGTRRRLDLSGVTDLATVWGLLEEAEKLVPVVPEELLPLRASADSVNRRAAESEEVARELARLEEREKRDLSPAGVFADQSFLEAAGVWMQMAGMANRGVVF